MCNLIGSKLVDKSFYVTKSDYLTFWWFSTEEEVEDAPYALRDKSHIEETLRLATDDKSGDYAGRTAGGNYMFWGVTGRQDPLV